MSIGSVVITLLGLPVYNYFHKLEDNDFGSEEIV